MRLNAGDETLAEARHTRGFTPADKNVRGDSTS
jgi:hypothetical protein